MSGIIHRGSPEHKAHLAGVEMEKKPVAPSKPIVPQRKQEPVKPEDHSKPIVPENETQNQK